jgi:hypothetical protein
LDLEAELGRSAGVNDRTIVVLSHRYDAGARAVMAELGARSLVPVLQLPPELLGVARWSHHIDSRGTARTQIVLPNGRVLADDEVGCLLNRLDTLPVLRFSRAKERDRDYAAMELQALVASWLAGLGDRVVNRSNARVLDTGPGSPRAWLALAAKRGVPVVPSALATSARQLPGELTTPRLAQPSGPFVPTAGGLTGRVPVEVGWSATGIARDATRSMPWGCDDAADEVIVVGSRALGRLADLHGEALLHVAADAGCLLVGFQFAGVGDQARLWRVSTRPSLGSRSHAAAVAALCLETADRGGGRR